jgi:hypothetical protein
MLKLHPAYLKNPDPETTKKTPAQKKKEREEKEAVLRMAILKGGK